MKEIVRISVYVFGLLVLVFVLLETAGPAQLRERLGKYKRSVVVFVASFLFIFLGIKLYHALTR